MLIGLLPSYFLTNSPTAHPRRSRIKILAGHKFMTMNRVNSVITPYVKTYREWILTKPQLIADIESTVRCLSYFSAGRFTNSPLASELIYSMPNLLILVNDRLIYNSKYAHLKLPQYQSKIKVWLTVIEYTEALVEVSARNLWGDKARWLLIVIIQTFKSILRLILIRHNNERITQTPAIPPLNREKLGDCFNVQSAKEGFALKRSGTVVRSVSNSGVPLQSRMWSPLMPVEAHDPNQLLSRATKKNIILAETLYIIKPLVHLGCLTAGGQKHWMPWSISFIMDIVSLQLFSQEAKNISFTKEEKEEIFRRRMSIFLYVLRSPFYDQCSKRRIRSLLNGVSKTVPFARFIAEPVAKYLPHWQNTYFYMWSS